MREHRWGARLAVGVVTPQLRQVYMDEAAHRALVSVGMGTRGLRRAAMERVKAASKGRQKAEVTLSERLVW